MGRSVQVIHSSSSDLVGDFEGGEALCMVVQGPDACFVCNAGDRVVAWWWQASCSSLDGSWIGFMEWFARQEEDDQEFKGLWSSRYSMTVSTLMTIQGRGTDVAGSTEVEGVG